MMNKLILCAGALTLTVACSKPAASASNSFVSSDANAVRPVATSGETAPAPASAAPNSEAATVGRPARSVREVTLPAGTVLPVALETSVGSDISRVEQPVQGRLRRAVVLHGVEVLPAGTAV